MLVICWFCQSSAEKQQKIASFAFFSLFFLLQLLHCDIRNITKDEDEYPNSKSDDLKTINRIVVSVNDVLRKVPKLDDRLHRLGHQYFYREDGSFIQELLSRDGLI